MKNETLDDYNHNDFFWKDFVTLPENPYKLDTDMSNFRCLFVFPTKKDNLSKEYYPNPLGNMASLLRMNGGHAEISTQEVENYNLDKFDNYNLICFYPMVTSFSKLMTFSSRVKKDHPDTKICFFNSDQHQHEMLLCNPKAKDFAISMMKKNRSLDYILVGEAETSFIKLCEKLNNNESDFENISSCLYKEGGQIKISEKPIEPVNFKFLPFTSRDFLEKTISPNGINASSPRIQSSRGCTAPCFYCVESSSNITLGGRKKSVLRRNLSTFIDEVEILQNKYGAVFFNIIDSSFEDSGKKGIERMQQFCDQIQERDINASFKIHLRAETISKLSDEFLDNLKYTGIDILILGVESNLEKELKSYRKISTIDKSVQSLKRLDDINKFFTIIGYIMFSPIVELDDLPNKVDFLKNIHYGWDHILMTSNMLIFPGTVYHEKIKGAGLTLEHDDLSTIIPYRFQDKRVGFVADEMSNLKIKHPEVITTNNLIYNSRNIISRYQNKINKHLWQNEGSFVKFKNNLNEMLYEIENTYASFFKEIVGLVQSNSSKNQVDLIYKKYISGVFEDFSHRVSNNLDSFIDGCKRKNLSTERLYLKTWASLKNTKLNSARGKNE